MLDQVTCDGAARLDEAPQSAPAWTRQTSRSRFPVYTEFFGLRGQPFSIMPDPSFLFWAPDHAKAYAILEYALASFAPLTLITGAVGAGKTTLVRQLLRSVQRELRIGLVSNAHRRRGTLLQWILASIDAPVTRRETYVQQFSRFEAALRRERAASRHTLLVFDEAQNLSESMLEELRCLLNLNDEQNELLQVLLVGQPEINETINTPRLLQFNQRILGRFHLAGIPRDAVGDYIAHRLAIAGASRPIFSPGACFLIACESRGIPRVINQICDISLIYAFAEEKKTIEPEIVRQVIRDLRN